MQKRQLHYPHHHHHFHHHHLQHQNYVPVTLTHIRPVEEKSNTSSVGSSDNVQKWMAFGLNKDVISSGSLGTLQLPATSPGGAVVVVEEEEAAGVVYSVEEDNNNNNNNNNNKEKRRSENDEMDSSIRRQLIALSSRVGHAREEENCVATRRERRGKNTEQTLHTNTTGIANSNNNSGSSNNSSSHDNNRNRKTNMSSGKKHNRESDGELGDHQPLVKRSAVTTTTTTTNRRKTIEEEGEEEEEKGKKSSTAEKKKKTSNRKTSTSAASKRQLKESTPPTLFSMPSDSSSESRQVTISVPFKEIDDNNINYLFNDIQDALSDQNRIQAPTLFVAFITHEGDTNFSISANTNGKVHFVRGVNPEMSHLKIKSFILRWKDEVLVIPSTPGLTFLVRVLEELPGVEIVTFNAPSLLLLLLSYRQGKLFTSCISDIRLMAWMLQTSEGSDAFTDYDVLLHSSHQQIGLSAGFRNVIGCSLKQIVCHRVYYMVPLYRSLYGQLGTLGLLPAFLKQEKRISLLCASMKLNGFTVNMSEVEGFKLRCASKMEELQASAQKLLPSMPDFNLQNLDECRIAIYEVLRLGTYLTHTESDGSSSCAVTVTKSGKLSTSEETLKLLASHHEFPRILIAYRKAAKLLQTYTVGMMETAIPLVNDEGEFTDRCITDGGNTNTSEKKLGNEKTVSDSSIKWVKLYPNFIQEGTDTGRLSCVEPNLQNLPRPRVIDVDDARVAHEAEMASFRRCFAAPAGCTLLSVDYEQIELRVLAHLSADAALVEALTHATDIHRAIAETLFRKSPVSGDERALAKRAVFGTLYGAGPRTLAAQMGVPLERAMRVAALFRAAFPHVAEFHRRVIAQCRADGGVRTLSGRRRRLQDIDDRVMGRRAGAERQAFNTVVQGSAADVVKLGMLAVEREVLRPHAGEVKLLAQIHDELVLAIPTDMLQRIVPLVTQSMAHAVSLLVPLRVTAKVGRSLGEMEEWSVDHDLGIREIP
ncbi:mitochondrial DNA polymerase I protein A [Trypanosoma theileri]|uniref:DNA-directed DNA polymerase n=1 Tax=Trypanosoma theileri TaxID=67003 RepID=A0A1X0P9E5_9TRYP|nr:mitochondrial DNA polymerase I protein A [Trypanosoma theileri]ORC93546.1 mitochondrial DNA polymerase I protein A [Trypanosoma theileri]